MKYPQLQRQKRSLSRIGRFVTPVLALIAFSLLFYLLVYKIGVFTINNTEVSGAKTFVSEVDLKELVKSRSFGKNILNFDSDELANSLKENFQGAKDIKVSKKFPNTISIYVIERTPIAIVYNESSNNNYLVDDNGYVLGIIAENTSNLPKILYEKEIEVGYFLDVNSVSVYFDLLKALDKEQVAVSSASIQPDHLLVYLRSSVEVLVDVKKDVYSAAHTLTQLLQKLSAEGKTPKRVDLRFDKVVVSYD